MKRYLLFTAALLTLAACNKDETGPEDSSAPVEIRLTSSLEAQTRATHGLDTQLAADETVYVWVDDAGTSDNLYENEAFTVGADGASLTSASGTTMYFPSSGNSVNIYAVNGNFSDDVSTFWSSTVTHTVETDQQSTGTGYALSDLLYCNLAGVRRTSDAISLPFNHLLSKVEVVLVPENELIRDDIKSLEIINTQLDAQFTPDKDSDITIAATGSTGDILIDNGTTDAGADSADVVLNEAIIVPQTLAAGTEFFRITTTQDYEIYYKLAEETVFESGKSYRYTLTVDLTELSVAVTIGSWDKDTISGEASAQ